MIKKRFISFIIIGLTLVLVSLSILSGCSSQPAATSNPASSTGAQTTAVKTTTSVAPTSQASTTQANIPTKTIELRITSNFSAGHTMNEPLVEWAKQVQQKSNGAIKVTLYENTLGKPTDFWDMVKSGSTQGSYIAEATNASRMPISCLVNMPFEVPSLVACDQVMKAFLKAGYLKEITDNFELLYFLPLIPQTMFMRNVKVAKLEDFKGLKFRSLSGVQGKMLTALGATGVSMAANDVYMGLQTGTIDAQATGVDNFLANKHYEVSKYGCRQPLFDGIIMLNLSKEAMNSLTPELQTLVRQTAETVSTANVQQKSIAVKDFWEQAASKVEVYDITPEELARWKAATANIASDYVKEWSEKGYPAKEAYALMQQTVKSMQ